MTSKELQEKVRKIVWQTEQTMNKRKSKKMVREAWEMVKKMNPELTSPGIKNSKDYFIDFGKVSEPTSCKDILKDLSKVFKK